MIALPTYTGPAVSAVLLYVTDGSSTGVSMSQSTSQSPWFPTTALLTVPTAAAFTVAVYLTVYVPGTVPAGSVHASGFALLQVNGATGVTVPRSRPVPSVSVSTRSVTCCVSLSVVVRVSRFTLFPYTTLFRSAVLLYVTDGSSTGVSMSQSTSQSP